MALCCCTVLVQSTCNGISAPEATLPELHSSCNSHAVTRSSGCYAAYHRYCNSRTTYPTSRQSIGVSREHSNNRVGLSCIRAHWKGNVMIGELRVIHRGCNSVQRAQYRDCLSAIHRYCRNRFGQDFSGISQEVPRVDHLYIGCFRAAFKEYVPVSFMRSLHGRCTLPNSESDNCFAAASRFCVRYHGLSGGITQQVNSTIMLVACYDADYSQNAYLGRTTDYYQDRREAVEVCSVEFNTTAGSIVQSETEVLKAVTYDNSGSFAPLKSTFTVSQDVTETSRFQFERPSTLTLSSQAASAFSTKVPFVETGKISLSHFNTATFGSTRETSFTKTCSHSSEVVVQPPLRMVKEASVTRASLEVPWTAVVKTGLGRLAHISGTWYGVSAHDFRVTQRNV